MQRDSELWDGMKKRRGEDGGGGDEGLRVRGPGPGLAEECS